MSLNPITLDADEVATCPHCGRAAIAMGNQQTPTTPNPEKGSRYRCKKCNAALETLEIRKRESDAGGRRGLPRDLLEADPDEVGR